MAQIPVSTFKSKISLEVPAVASQDPSRAGIAYGGLKQLGQTIAAVGEGIGDLELRRQKAKADSYMDTLSAEFHLRDAKGKQDSAEFYKGSDFSGYANDRQKFFRDEEELALEAAPNEDAKQRVKLFFSKEAGTSFLKDESYEKRQAADFYSVQWENNRDLRSQVAYESPSLDFAYKNKVEMDNFVMNSEVHDPEEKLQQLGKNNQITEDTLEGMLRVGGGKLTEGMAFVTGKTKFDGLLAGMDPKRREVYRNKFENAIKAEQNRNVNNLLMQSSDLAAEVELNGFTPKTRKALANNIASLERYKKVDGFQGAELSNHILRLKKSHAMAEDRSLYKDAKFEDIIKAKVVLNDSKAGIKTHEQAELFKARLDFANKYATAIVEDPVRVAVEENPTYKEGTQELYNYQLSKGYPRPEYYSNATAKSIKDGFTATQDKMKALDEFLSNGDVIAKRKWLLSSAVNDEEMARVAFAADIKSDLTKRILLNTNPVEVNEAFKSRFKDDDEVKTVVNKHLDDSMFLDGYNEPGDLSYANAMSGLLETRTKQLMIGGYDLKKAANMARKEIIDSNVSFVSSKNTVVPLTGQFNNWNSKRKIQGFIEAYSSSLDEPETIKDLGIDFSANVRENSTIKNNEDFMKAITRERATLKVSPRNKRSFIIEYEDHIDPNIKSTVKAFKNNPDGSRVRVDLEIPFEDVISSSSRFNKAINNELSTSGLFGSVWNTIMENVPVIEPGFKSKEFDKGIMPWLRK